MGVANTETDFEAQRARQIKLDSFMRLTEICMYVKHF